MIWKDKVWILPHLLKSLTLLDYPKEKIGMRFIVMPVSTHERKDDTFRLLMGFKKAFFNQYRFISVWTFDMGNVRSSKPEEAKKNNIWNMQLGKNLLMDALSKKDEYIFYLDSNTIVDPKSLSRLVDIDRDVVSGFVTGERKYVNIGHYNPNMNAFEKDFDSCMRMFENREPDKVAFISDMMLMRYWVAKKIKFYQSNKTVSSEDDGAMRDMMKNNIDRWAHPLATGYRVSDAKDLADFAKKTGVEPLEITSDEAKYVEVKIA
jgi:hypothetical protein